MANRSTPKDGTGNLTELEGAAAILQGLERKRDRLAEQLRPLLVEYRATQMALASLRQVASFSTGGVVGRLSVDDVPRLPRREQIATRERARELAELQELERSGLCRPVGKELGIALRLGSLPYLAREALLAVGQPLHADELLERLNLGGTAAKRTSLVTALARLAAEGQVFYRVESEANTFGLLEWLGPSRGGDTLAASPTRRLRRP